LQKNRRPESGWRRKTAIVAANLPGNYFEVYKIAVEMADRMRLAPRLAALRPWLAQNRELGVIERTVPWVFMLVYLADIVRQLAR
jgi:hypothetical protein